MRTSYFLDIDNLCGSGRPDEADVAAVFAQLDQVCPPDPDDLVYCAGTRASALHAKSLRSGYCTRVGHGVDGADLQLLDLADLDVLQRQFDRVVIGSGDHIFATRARELVARGLRVDVVARQGSVARELRRSLGLAGSVIELDRSLTAEAA
jgi:hypothetical protein